MAADLDKNAEVVDGSSNIGFGYIEIDTIRLTAQAENSNPHLFRLTKQKKFLFNNMGFNILSIETVNKNIQKVKSLFLLE